MRAVHTCPICQAPAPERAAFCPSCGSALDAGATSAVTTAAVTAAPLTVFPATRHAGTVVASRYRLVGLLGRGGMGEVYRADDLKLGQTVALKFLPPDRASDPAALARFHREVRIARQITHPGVCRLYDIGEAGGEHFLTMEYVDGEDLSSLLRRIGRLPHDKAVEIARQLCGALMAAHSVGVLHRDLKPANIMLDGRGRAKITDFGLADILNRPAQQEVAGTPAYMAPEQLTSAGASVRSDIYALGAVLYELFTGRPALDVSTFAERALAAGHRPRPASDVVPEIDPAIEALILRCLEPDPTRRPASVAALAAALPGSDPIQAALAAGETPSPEMVAAGGEHRGMRPAAAWVTFVLLVIGALLNAAASHVTRLHAMAPLELSSDVLRDRARAALAAATYGPAPFEASGFQDNTAYLRWLTARGSASRPGAPAVLFWYRESVRPIVAWRPDVFVTAEDPPRLQEGMREAWLDAEGRLVRLTVRPEAGGQRPAQDPWARLLAAAGFDPAAVTPVDARALPPVFADARGAWKAAPPGDPAVEVRIEWASFSGRPVYFNVIGPWDPLWDAGDAPRDPQRPLFTAVAVVTITLLVGASLLAYRNVSLGRGDRRGAKRLAVTVFGLALTGFLIGAPHTADPGEEVAMLSNAIGLALTYAFLFWVLYLAMEPFIRRLWPDLIVSWTRLLDGRARDPVVGRDILIGGALGVVGPLMVSTVQIVGSRAGWVLQPEPIAWLALGSGRQAAALALLLPVQAVAAGLGIMFMLVVLTIVFRRRAFGAAAFAGIMALLFFLEGETPLARATALVPAVVLTVVVLRLGVLAAVAFHATLFFCIAFPLTLDPSAWYAGTSFLALAVVVATGIYGLHTTLGGRPLAGLRLLDDVA
jgi:serine/threonine-protein kinase